MKEISIETKASRTAELTLLTRVASYAKNHQTDIANVVTVLTLAYTMLALEADNFVGALVSLAISAVAFYFTKGGGRK